MPSNEDLDWIDLPTTPGWYYEISLDFGTGGSYQNCCWVVFPSLIEQREGVYYCGPLPLPMRPPKNRKWTEARWAHRRKRIAETGVAQI